MESIDTRKYEANALRKAGNFREALALYQDLWNSGIQDEYIAAGILQCLRKLHSIADALKFCDNAMSRYSESEWFRQESSWTYSDYIKEMAEAEVAVSTLHAIGEKALVFRPVPNAFNQIAFRIMNAAKNAKDWKTLLIWVERVDPSTLSSVGMKLPDGKEGWSYLARYSNYRIIALIGNKRADEAIPLCQKALGDFPHQYKQFAYNLARAYSTIGAYEKARDAFQELFKKSVLIFIFSLNSAR